MGVAELPTLVSGYSGAEPRGGLWGRPTHLFAENMPILALFGSILGIFYPF